jgi:hypothetical protein
MALVTLYGLTAVKGVLDVYQRNRLMFGRQPE